jgi:NADH:ubiquinone oxidoreductase subunit D
MDADRDERSSLSRALGFSESVIELGHGHPGLRRVLETAGGTIAFLVALDDERIVDLEVEIGLGHRGFEKEVESRAWHLAFPYVARLGYGAGVMAEVGYALGVEALAGVDAPERATWARMLASELARATDHFARLAAVAGAIGLPAGERVARQGEVEAARSLSSVTGGGPFAGWVRLGGVAAASPSERFSDDWSASRATLDRIVARYGAVTLDNPSARARLRDVAPLAADDCQTWSVSGPALRAAGHPADVRRDAPYLAYDAVDFDVAIGESGDDFDRVLVVLEEIRQALRIADQCAARLAELGPGPWRAEAPGWRDDAALDGAARSDERLAGPAVPAGEITVATESSTGELGFLLVSDGGPLPRRVRCRAPSFFHAQAMPAMLRGGQLDDLLPTAAVLHLVSGECDR